MKGDENAVTPRLLTDADLERSSIVANSRMNRERRATGVNSYERELRFDPVAFLKSRLDRDAVSWLDLCCGRGRALIEASESLRTETSSNEIELHGVDLVAMFDGPTQGGPRLEAASLHQWSADRDYDLITCVHGLHYIGDKLALIRRALRWLRADGVFLAHLDLANVRIADCDRLNRLPARRLRRLGFEYDRRRGLLRRDGRREVDFELEFLGADDTPGPNATGQEAVDSVYRERSNSS